MLERGAMAELSRSIAPNLDFVTMGSALCLHLSLFVCERARRELLKEVARRPVDQLDLPSSELEIKDDHIIVDGVALDPASANFPARALWSASDRIPSGCYLMLGDNRNRSDDSHLWGFAQTGGTFQSGPREGQRASFTGHAFVRFWPLDRAALLGR